MLVGTGDPAQLPPGMGGLSVGLLSAIVNINNNTLLARSMRTFKRSILLEGERDRGDVWQSQIISRLRDSSGILYKNRDNFMKGIFWGRGAYCICALITCLYFFLTGRNLYPLRPTADFDLLASSCPFCEEAGYPTAECRHLHVLKEADFLRDPSWMTAPSIFPGHSGEQAVLLMKMQQFAKERGQILLRWIKPCHTSSGQNYDIYQESKGPSSQNKSQSLIASKACEWIRGDFAKH